MKEEEKHLTDTEKIFKGTVSLFWGPEVALTFLRNEFLLKMTRFLVKVTVIEKKDQVT